MEGITAPRHTYLNSKTEKKKKVHKHLNAIIYMMLGLLMYGGPNTYYKQSVK